jgi:hypothetical protein
MGLIQHRHAVDGGRTLSPNPSIDKSADRAQNGILFDHLRFAVPRIIFQLQTLVGARTAGPATICECIVGCSRPNR